VSLVEYAGGKRSLRAYIAVRLQIHCNPSSVMLALMDRNVDSYLTTVQRSPGNMKL